MGVVPAYLSSLCSYLKADLGLGGPEAYTIWGNVFKKNNAK